MDDERFAVRQRAQRQLELSGEASLPYLVAALQSPKLPLEQRQRVGLIVAKLRSAGMAPQTLRALRAIS